MANQAAFDRSKQYEIKKRAIILEAAKAFNENGYGGTPVDEIARRLGVTKKALYYYVKNKNHILYEIFNLWLDVQEQCISLADTDGQNGTEKILIYAKTYVTRALKELVTMDRLAGEIGSLDDEYKITIMKRRHDNDVKLRAFFAEGQKSGDLQKRDPKFEVYVLNGSLDWIFKWFDAAGPLDEKTAAEKITDILFSGFLTR